jgi:demethylmenaquinone methyltransferase/2-methoxy-6-polyprenyl-1,4-benzoquinol methylase
MAPFRLPTKEEKPDYILRQFDQIAPGYDLTNDVISLGMHHFWKQRAIEALAIKSTGNYLDVCCGTGDLAFAIAKKLNENGKVVGLDFSRSMLDVAAQRTNRNTTKASIKWIQGDATKLPFEENEFDGAIISFGLRNLSDLQLGVNEMARVVKPGGRVVNLDLGHSEAFLFSSLFHFYFRHVVPWIGAILQKDRSAYTYLPESLTTYPKPTGITELFQRAGLRDIKHIPLALGSVALHIGTK